MSLARCLSALLDTLPSGIRPGARYRRHGVARVMWNGRELSALPTAQLLSMAKGVRLHTAGTDAQGRPRRWSARDTRIMRELHARAYTVTELQCARTVAIPAWLIQPGVVDHRWLLTLAYLLRAYRQGAVGLLLSYEEAEAMGLAPSRTTWWRWLAKMEAAGMVVHIDTWRRADGEAGTRERARARNLYQPGPALLELAGGPDGALEGCDDDDDPDTRGTRQRRHAAAAVARRAARVVRRTRHALAWRRQRGAPTAAAAEAERAEAERDEPRVGYVSPEGGEFYVLDGDDETSQDDRSTSATVPEAADSGGSPRETERRRDSGAPCRPLSDPFHSETPTLRFPQDMNSEKEGRARVQRPPPGAVPHPESRRRSVSRGDPPESAASGTVARWPRGHSTNRASARDDVERAAGRAEPEHRDGVRKLGPTPDPDRALGFLVMLDEARKKRAERRAGRGDPPEGWER